MGKMVITVNARVNLPPSQVGDNTLITSHATQVVFTRDDFTTNTTPAYSDPEGDPAENLRVLNLPANGTLNLNAVAVTVNQVISFTDIDSGLFTYDPDPNITTLRDVEFDSEIADSGSGQYTQ